MKKQNSTTKLKRFNCKSLYSLHYPDDYADHIEKKRNRQWFLKLQQLEKKSQELREQMELLLQKHSVRVTNTQQLVSMTLDINNRCVEKTAGRKP